MIWLITRSLDIRTQNLAAIPNASSLCNGFAYPGRHKPPILGKIFGCETLVVELK